MLNGIGGETIAVAKERLSAREVRLWAAYRERHGGLNPMMRADWNAGLLASLFANSKRKPSAPAFQVTDFLRYQKAEPIGLEEAMASWG
ncbi:MULTISPECIES: phage tail assembly protein T [Stenotrophomonas]|uniref:phage tail assembly protein T n=1 Tax=Stenotrophomonas TaxID=40323 RepID=UPI00089DDAA4|nr:phage tail protein [Stenotrophomonas sp. LM091]AOX63624.1 phage tail protein [Stenotrophomonas sp. LM091]HAV73166.1 phage tail protein [Stenotrophomonas sp.]